MMDRVKPLKSVSNFRDFGGYDTTEGGHVKSGLLFRAGHFHEVTPEDAAFLDDLKIDFQVDLRRTEERNRQPNQWKPDEVHDFDDGETFAQPAHIAYLVEGKATEAGARAYMVDYYRKAPFRDSHVDLYTRWFKRLGEPGGAGLINCAAGKDRTGIGCALTLHLLGVDDDTVMQDYELTNTAVNIDARLPEAHQYLEERTGLSLERGAVRPFMGVEVDYLTAAFEVINAKHGSLRDYARDALGVDDALISRMRDRLLK